MVMTGETPSIENQILATIQDFKEMEKRMDLETICKVIVKKSNGLSKSDIINTMLKMHKEGI